MKQALERWLTNPPRWQRVLSLLMWALLTYGSWAKGGPELGLLACVLWGVVLLPLAVAPRQWAHWLARHRRIEALVIAPLLMGGLVFLQVSLNPERSREILLLVLGVLVVAIAIRAALGFHRRRRASQMTAVEQQPDRVAP